MVSVAVSGDVELGVVAPMVDASESAEVLALPVGPEEEWPDSVLTVAPSSPQAAKKSAAPITRKRKRGPVIFRH